jgi:hypothetical protein
MAAKRSGCLISLRPGSPLRAVSWWTITSGSVSATARATASGSSASATTGWAKVRSMSVLAGERVMPITSWPAAASWGTSWLPIAPVAPATNTFMAASFPIHLRADTRAVTSRDKTALLPVTHGPSRLSNRGLLGTTPAVTRSTR